MNEEKVSVRQGMVKDVVEKITETQEVASDIFLRVRDSGKFGLSQDEVEELTGKFEEYMYYIGWVLEILKLEAGIPNEFATREEFRKTFENEQ